jgi:hypothetical protein
VGYGGLIDSSHSLGLSAALSGVEGSGVEGSGVEGSGVEGSGVEGSGVEGSGVEGPPNPPYTKAQF